MEETHDDPRLRYQLCRSGFALTAVALGVLSLSNLLFIGSTVARGIPLQRLAATPAWFWGVETLIPWTSLLGSYLLWGRWKVTSWQWRAGLLVLMSLNDVVVWGLYNASRLGLPREAVRLEHGWLIEIATHAFGWFELMLAASLAASLAAHLGSEGRHGPEAGRPAMTLSAIGAAIWAYIAISFTDWSAWPLRLDAGRRMFEFHHFVRINLLIQTVVTFMVTVQCAAVARHCKTFLQFRDLERDRADDLRSRSETEGDDILWK